MLHGCPPSPDAWGRLNVVTPFHHLSGDSHINSSLREGPLRHLVAFGRDGVGNRMPWGKGLMFSLIASKSFWGQTAMMLVVLAVRLVKLGPVIGAFAGIVNDVT
jgi:hypothetical protein